ncbi:MAG: MBL fold metallo-hydrolase [Trueperaceae bacterium]
MQPHQGEQHDDVRFHRVTGRVTVALGPVKGERVLANASIVVGERHTAIIDTMLSPDMMAPVREEAVRLGGRPVSMVVFTHGDPDHVLGQAAFPDAMTVAEERVIDVLNTPAVIERYQGILTSAGAEPVMPTVDVAYREHGRVDLGGLHLEATRVGPAHSPADTVLWCPQERVAWSGDLVFNGVFPFVRGPLERWFAGLDLLESWEPEVVIPGHGLVADARILAAERAVLRAIEDEIVALHREGVGVDEAVGRVRVEAYRHLPLAGERIEGAVRGIYPGLRRG